MCLPGSVTNEAATEADVVDELFGGPREGFLAVRTERAAQARAAGDRDLAKRISALRKPTVAAWLVNRLVRSSPEDVDALDVLARRLADAHSHGSGDEVRVAGEQRRELLRHLANRIRELAGGRIGEDIVTQVTTTFQAALIDPDALAAVRSGRLSTAVELDQDMLDAWATHQVTRRSPVTPPTPTPTPASAPTKPSKSTTQAKPTKAARPKRNRALTAARTRAADAETAREQAERELELAREATSRADQRLAAARAELDAARQAHDAARATVAAARTAVSAAVRAENAAQRAVVELESSN